MKLLALSPHFEWPALYPQALADFQDLITLAEVDKDGFHHVCWAPSFFSPRGCWYGRLDPRIQLWLSVRLLLAPPATSQCKQSLL